jgi:hypothetical protein
MPEGMELYLDRADLLGADYLARTLAAVDELAVPSTFVWIVEAPIRTLQERFFDLTSADDDHRETLRRVLEVGRRLGAVAANIHVVTPTLHPESLDDASNSRALEHSRPLLDFYVDRCESLGLIPQVENIPPVGRMRESTFMYSPIGGSASDLLALAEMRPELRFTVDVSHAALYLNWRRSALDTLEPPFRRAGEFAQRQPGPADLISYLDALAGGTTTIHVSNARGLLGEGLRYGDGDEDLDGALSRFVDLIPYFVTETLEPDPVRATGMREAQTRLMMLVKSVRGAIA